MQLSCHTIFTFVRGWPCGTGTHATYSYLTLNTTYRTTHIIPGSGFWWQTSANENTNAFIQIKNHHTPRSK
jgi:hypothetical protein